MQLHRLRTELPDSPGTLGRIASTLADLGINVLDVDVHSVGGERRADEMVIELRVPLDLPAIDHALRKAGCEAVDLRPVDPHELVDETARGLELAGALVAHEHVGADALANAARRLVRADQARVVTAPLLRATGVARRAAEQGVPCQAREPVKSLSGPGRHPWSLAVPFSHEGADRVLVLARRSPRFSFTETARVQALLDVAAAGRPRRESVVHLTDGGTVALRSLRREDGPALERMHRRCSRDSLYRRYLNATAPPPAHVVEQLLDVDGRQRVGYVATTGSEVIGVAYAMRRPGTAAAEIAFLVEDGHRRRGIATVLLHRLVASVASLGVSQLAAVTSPDNRALISLLHRPGWEVSSELADGLLALTARPGQPAPVDPRPGGRVGG